MGSDETSLSSPHITAVIDNTNKAGGGVRVKSKTDEWERSVTPVRLLRSDVGPVNPGPFKCSVKLQEANMVCWQRWMVFLRPTSLTQPESSLGVRWQKFLQGNQQLWDPTCRSQSLFWKYTDFKSNTLVFNPLILKQIARQITCCGLSLLNSIMFLGRMWRRGREPNLEPESCKLNSPPCPYIVVSLSKTLTPTCSLKAYMAPLGCISCDGLNAENRFCGMTTHFTFFFTKSQTQADMSQNCFLKKNNNKNLEEVLICRRGFYISIQNGQIQRQILLFFTTGTEGCSSWAWVRFCWKCLPVRRESFLPTVASCCWGWGIEMKTWCNLLVYLD